MDLYVAASWCVCISICPVSSEMDHESIFEKYISQPSFLLARQQSCIAVHCTLIQIISTRIWRVANSKQIQKSLYSSSFVEELKWEVTLSLTPGPPLVMEQHFFFFKQKNGFEDLSLGSVPFQKEQFSFKRQKNAEQWLTREEILSRLFIL